MTHGLHAELSVVCQSGAIPPNWKNEAGCPYLEKRKGSDSIAKITVKFNCTVCRAVFLHLLLMRV